MGADAADLDRFDSDSEEPNPVPAAAPPSAGASPSSPADAKGGGTSKAARLRAKKAAARAAQKARRREEKARFPPRPENALSSTVDDDARECGSDGEDDERECGSDERGSDGEADVFTKKKPSRDAAFARDVSDKTHHGVLNIEGVVVDGKLVLVDRDSKHVYSSTRRARDGTHLRVGVWDADAETVRRFPRRETAPDASEKPDATEHTLEPSEQITASARMEPPPASVTHAFEVDPDDHCETSPEAHANVVNFLAKIAERVGKRPSELVIYDPYYCAGGTKRSFKTLGFANVINENEDFYDVIARDAVPEHDVLITNPPYSADHVEKCLTFAAENLEKHARPYFLLLPSYVVNKPYYVDALLTGGARGRAWCERTKEEAKQKEGRAENVSKEAVDSEAGDSEPTHAGDAAEAAPAASSGDAMKIHDRERIPLNGKIRDVKRSGSGRKQTLPFYVAPSKRYYYWTPKALASSRRRGKAGEDEDAERKKKKKGHVGRLGERTSPFPSFWYCGLGEGFQTEALRWHRKLPRAMVDGYAVASHPNDLPLHVLDEWDPRREKLMAAARDGEISRRNGGERGAARKPPPRRFAGFSGANCGQNMPAKDKKRYGEFAAASSPRKSRKEDWGVGGGSRPGIEGAAFAPPRRKNKR